MFCLKSVFDIGYTFRNKLILYKIKRTTYFPKFYISVTNEIFRIKFANNIVKLKIKGFC